MIITTCGAYALRAGLTNMSEALTTARFVRSADVPGVVDIVTAGNSVVITYNDVATEAPVRMLLAECVTTLPSFGTSQLDPEELPVPVRYDGPDLDRFARALRLSPGDAVAWHHGSQWMATEIGDRVGHWRLDRTDAAPYAPYVHAADRHVPRGAVLFGAGRTGIHQFGGPTRWLHIGTVTHNLPAHLADPVHRLGVGASVQFVPWPTLTGAPSRTGTSPTVETTDDLPVLEVPPAPNPPAPVPVIPISAATANHETTGFAAACGGRIDHNAAADASAGGAGPLSTGPDVTAEDVTKLSNDPMPFTIAGTPNNLGNPTAAGPMGDAASGVEPGPAATWREAAGSTSPPIAVPNRPAPSSDHDLADRAASPDTVFDQETACSSAPTGAAPLGSRSFGGVASSEATSPDAAPSTESTDHTATGAVSSDTVFDQETTSDHATSDASGSRPPTPLALGGIAQHPDTHLPTDSASSDTPFNTALPASAARPSDTPSTDTATDRDDTPGVPPGRHVTVARLTRIARPATLARPTLVRDQPKPRSTRRPQLPPWPPTTPAA